MRNIRRRAVTRVNAARQLSASNTVPKGFRYPKCSEYASPGGKYFATVFVDVIDNKTKTKRRIRIPFSTNDKLSESEIIDQAIGYIEAYQATSRHQFDTNDPLDAGETIDINSANLGAICDTE